MTLIDFLNIDKDFNEAMFLTKVDNIFIKLFTGIMLNELEDVRHFISNNIYNYYKNINMQLLSKNQRQMYEELNVKNSKIISIKKDDLKYIIEVNLDARYMDYILDLETGNCICGDNTRRIEEHYCLTFVRNINVSKQNMIRKCSSCGAVIDVNDSGRCTYCHSIYNLDDYDWILDKIEKRLF